jgi:hypothetical protein
LKNIKVQKRKVYSNKILDYLDLLIRKISGISFMGKISDIYEIHYASDYKFLLQNFDVFKSYFFQIFNVNFLDMRKEIFDENKLQNKIKHKEFYHSRQLYYSNDISKIDYDILYSEIFLLDM